ncbi:DUF2793 domain-containing protein [Rhizobium sp. RU36D]|uniref:DUF2793 domain-containing protein n=1 Tax=Rhizobium sp. RU36D TaxID=1907415 RepID=UPI0009D845FF|nr:DUF2793 domain-containing protein [Rhizobium sp. RU36D]SMC40107.1 Protein of unknown function [Rhizobium sp. RU36D]
MSDLTPNLALPFLLPAQAQKHVTHNEALLGLDAVVQLVLAGQASAPPAAPQEGDRYFILAGASGAWTGKSGKIAAWYYGAWQFVTPQAGWQAFDRSNSCLSVFDGTAWIPHWLPLDGGPASLGINTTSDTINRLAVAAPATLLTHEGQGHQLKINKANALETASLMFQTNWQGRAEMGLAGSDDFAIKVSSDGDTWTTALSIGPDGIARMENRPAVRAARATVDHAPASGTLTGFDSLFDIRGGFVLGTALSSGLGHRLVIPADGTYLLSLNLCVLTSTGHTARLIRNGTTTLAAIEGIAGSGPLTQHVMTSATLSAGDWLAIGHEGTATLRFGPLCTEIVAAMI